MPYKISKNYNKLWELLLSGEKIYASGVCHYPTPQRVAGFMSYFLDAQYPCFVLPGLCGGCGDTQNELKETFLTTCGKLDIEFIDPEDCQPPKKIWKTNKETPEPGRLCLVFDGDTWYTSDLIFGKFHLYDWEYELSEIQKWAYVSDLEEKE